MEQRPLGTTGLTVSALGYGSGAIGGLFVRGDRAEQRRAVARALEAGITYFDTAPQYGSGRSEENLGRVLGELDAWGRVVVGTKVRLGEADLDDAPAAIARSIEASLRRLGRDHVDLLQLHNPVVDAVAVTERSAGAVDLEAVRDGIRDGLGQVKARGLARHVGFTGLGATRAIHDAATGAGFETVQAYFNAVNPSAGYPGAAGGEQNFDGLIDVAGSAGLGVIAIRVLAAGALAARAERHPNAGDPSHPLIEGAGYDRDLERAGELLRLAGLAGLDGPAELAVRFALTRSGVSTVLVGFSDVTQLEDAIRWAERGSLAADLVRRVVDAAR